MKVATKVFNRAFCHTLYQYLRELTSCVTIFYGAENLGSH
jgi:hypothetical protein